MRGVNLKPVAAVAVALCAQGAWATEGGGSTYNPGVENFMVGAAPPPGFYMMEYLTHYRASRLNDNNGEALPIPGFSVKAFAAATRFIWSTDVRVGNGNLVLHGIVPLVDLKVSVAGMSQHKTGLGDITFGPGIAYHHSPALHSVLGFDLVAPTGSYSATNLANLGRNYWSLQPFYTVTHVDPTGFNGDFKATLNFNRRNRDTDYRSGTEFILDYSAGWGFGNGWTAGVGGYAYQQLSDDKLAGVGLAGSKGRGFAIGPSVKYDNGKGFFVTVKWQKEFAARSRPEGAAFWVKATIPL